jgi:chitodextrinase
MWKAASTWGHRRTGLAVAAACLAALAILAPITAGANKAPRKPGELALTGVEATSLSVSWKASNDNEGKHTMAGYGLYRDGTSLGTTRGSTYTFDALTCGTTYTVGVDTFDQAGRRSDIAQLTASTAACGSPPADTSPPSAPSGLNPTSVTGTGISLAWNGSADNVDVAGYGLYRNGARVGTARETTFAFGDLACGTGYTLAVEAFDAAGNRSPKASVVVSTSACPATTSAGTAATTSASAATTTSASPDTTSATLTLPAEADARVAESSPSRNFGASYLRADGGSDPDVETYLRFTVGAVASPVQRAVLRVYAYSYTADGPEVYPTVISWSETTIAWTGRPVRTGGAIAQKGTIRSNSWVEYDVTPAVSGAGTYSFVLATTSSDGVNMNSRESSSEQPQLVITTGPRDTQPPTAPTDLARTSTTETSIGLSWTASSDDTGVVGYGLDVNGTSVGTTPGTSYSFAGLVCGTTYTLGVDAYDAAGNSSPRSTLSATTAACATPPQPPPPPPPAGECDKFAARTGSDTNPGTATAPFKTARRLADSLTSGQTGCLRAGTYDETSNGYVLNLSRGGYMIRSYPGERAKLVGIIQVRNSAAGVTLSHLRIEGTGGANTVKIYAPDVVVEDSDITNVARGESCMILGSNSGYGQAARVIVRRNRFHDCGAAANLNHDHGIYAQNVVDGQIVGNVFWNSAAYAIQFYPNAQRTRFAHNVVEGDTPSIRGGVIFGGSSTYASSNNVVENNVIAYAKTYNVTSSWSGAVGSGNIARNNCVWAGSLGNVNTSKGGFTATANTIADPLFLDRVKRDYRLGPTSVCLAVVGFDAVAALGW